MCEPQSITSITVGNSSFSLLGVILKVVKRSLKSYLDQPWFNSARYFIGVRACPTCLESTRLMCSPLAATYLMVKLSPQNVMKSSLSNNRPMPMKWKLPLLLDFKITPLSPNSSFILLFTSSRKSLPSKDSFGLSKSSMGRWAVLCSVD